MKSNIKTRVGVVVSDKMDKTVTVEIERRTKDSLTGKIIRRHNKFKAHDEKNECEVEDKVKIVETRPISKHKRWRIETILEKHK